MSSAKKFRVTAVFGVGLLACIASVVRLVYSVELLRVPTVNAAPQLVIDKEGLWAYSSISPS